jgi:hypothetical protein
MIQTISPSRHKLPSDYDLTMPDWVFAELAGAAIRRDPKESELFKTEQAAEGEYAWTDSLVREIIQNSMDAGTGDGPVRVRLSIHQPDELPAKGRLKSYFKRIKPPLAYRGIKYKNGIPDLKTGFLVCEDFGTRGLGGDPLLSTEPDKKNGQPQDFFWFWRNIGLSGKTDDDLGRWGLGKTVYRKASQVGCMLGLTVRACDGRAVLMGQAVLRLHKHEGAEYMPEGFWCDGCDETGFPLPIEDADEINRFRNEWKISRTDEPGLSVVVPYVVGDLKPNRIVQAVCAHFFMPIIDGKLIVEVNADEIGETRVDQNTIENVCKTIVWDGPKRTKRHCAPPIKFAKECISYEELNETNILGDRNRMPSLADGCFEEDELKTLQQDFIDGKLVGINVRMNLIQRDPDELVVGEFKVFLKNGDASARQDSYFVREGMTITKLNSTAGRRRGIKALVVVEKGHLASMLGDSEGPAHEDWDKSAERPELFWSKWKGRIGFVRKIVDSMVEYLTPAVEEADFDILSEVFSIERSQAPRPKLKPDADGKKASSFDAIDPNPLWYRMSPRSGGFTIRPTGAVEVPENAMLQVSVAYDLPSGNPLSKWSKYDFEFRNKKSAIKCKGKNVGVKIVQGNILEVSISDPDFSFSADGFDELRDLFVRLDELGEPTESSSTLKLAKR